MSSASQTEIKRDREADAAQSAPRLPFRPLRTFGTEVTNTFSSLPKPSSPTMCTPSHRPIVISIEAAIGTGKSSLLNLIKSRKPEWIVVQEPVDEWQNVAGSGHNLLQQFYENMERYAFSFQTYCVLSRIDAVTKALEKTDAPVVILERSWFSDRHTFGEMLHKQKRISDLEWTLYEKWFEFAVRNSPYIDGHVYLQCHPETCMSRLRKRSRSEEVAVTESYQMSLIDAHETWLQNVDASRICRIDVNKDFMCTSAASDNIFETLNAFCATLEAARSSSLPLIC